MGDKCFFNVQMITVQWRSAQEKEVVLRKYLSVDIAKKCKSTMSLWAYIKGSDLMKKRNTELMISPGFLHKFTKSLPDCSTSLEKK